MGRFTEGDDVNEKRGYSSAPAEARRLNPRAATPNNRRSFRSSLKGSMKGSLKRAPSLIFADANSESDDLTSCGFSDHRPRRQCSFVSRGNISSEIMDLRLLDSEHGSGTRRSSYDLSVCSAGSFETLKTTDEKMGMFEVTLPSALKIKKAAAVTKETADHTSSGNEGDDENPKGLINTLAARRRLTMDTIWSTRKSLPTSSSPPTSPQDATDPSVTKSPRKVRARRCAQAAAIFVLLATFVVFPWLVIAVYFGMEDNDPSSLISSVTAKIPGMLENLFDPRDEIEVRHEQLVGEPPFVPTGVNGRHLRVLEEDELLRRRERVAKERQDRIEADEEKRRMIKEQRERRVQKQKNDEEVQGDEDMIPQDSEDEPDHQGVKLNTFVY
mmetsp:Transcript_27985/g.56175  ORF Transcript_27985/g.56175 Transcript_27985/m.56175 type:complete len:385 (-) Transcript_27985:31-1185(-)